MTEDLIYLGKKRPDWPLPCLGKGYVMCQCGTILELVEQIYSHWQSGHFDTPVYCTKDKMMDRIAKGTAQEAH